MFSLPSDLLISLLDEWLDIRDVGRLDSALCSNEPRKEFLRCLSSKGFVVKVASQYGDKSNVLRWVSLRDARVNELQCCGNFYLEDYNKLSHNLRAHLSTIFVHPQCVLNGSGLHSLVSCFPSLGVLKISQSLNQLVGTDLLTILPLLSNLKTLHLSQITQITNDCVYNIANCCPALENIQLVNCREIHPTCTFGLLSRLPMLKSIRVESCYGKSEDDFGENVSPLFSRLETLELVYCWYMSEVALSRLLTFCPNLTSLTVRGTVLSSRTVELIASKFPRLQSLYLGASHSLSDDHLRILVGKFSSNLLVLDASYCSKVSDSGLKVITDVIQQLQSLNLQHCHLVSDAGVLTIAHKLSHLRNLNLRQCFGITSDAVVALFQKCRLLEELYLSDCRLINDCTFQRLASAVNTSSDLNTFHLRTLDLEGCTGMQDAGLITIAHLFPRLVDLNLSRCVAVGSAGVVEFLQLRGRTMHHLTLKRAVKAIHVSTLAAIAQYGRRLESLDVSHCYCGVVPVEALLLLATSCPRLKCLKIEGTLQESVILKHLDTLKHVFALTKTSVDVGKNLPCCADDVTLRVL